MELASHLWDEDDPAYAVCRCGLTSLYEHCSTENGGQVRVLADSESLLAHMLYQRTAPGYAEMNQRISTLAQRIACAPPGTLPQEVRGACKVLSDKISTQESMFVQDMREVVQQMNPACANWSPFRRDKLKRDQALVAVRDRGMPWRIALAHVRKVRALLGIPPDAPELKEMADTVLEHIPASIALYREILERLVTTGCDLSKPERANWIWDMQILMGIGESIGNPPRRVTVVTGDKAIVEAAQTASVGDCVKSLDDYLSELQAYSLALNSQVTPRGEASGQSVLGIVTE